MSLKVKGSKDLAGVSQALRIIKKECMVNKRAFPVDEQGLKE